MLHLDPKHHDPHVDPGPLPGNYFCTEDEESNSSLAVTPFPFGGEPHYHGISCESPLLIAIP